MPFRWALRISGNFSVLAATPSRHHLAAGNYCHWPGWPWPACPPTAVWARLRSRTVTKRLARIRVVERAERGKAWLDCLGHRGSPGDGVQRLEPVTGVDNHGLLVRVELPGRQEPAQHGDRHPYGRLAEDALGRGQQPDRVHDLRIRGIFGETAVGV